MVKVKNSPYINPDGTIHLEAWLTYAAAMKTEGDLNLIRQACVLARFAGEEKPVLTGISCLQLGLMMAEILLDLHLDADTIAASIIYPSVQQAELHLEDIREPLGETVAKLVKGTLQMESLRALPHLTDHLDQVEGVRKMLLAMVQDMRVVLIKLAERTAILRTLSHFDNATQKQISSEILNIYAPLANRLGIFSLKWELEDLAFRYKHPQEYETITKFLNEPRLSREAYIQDFVEYLKTQLDEAKIKNFEISGRVKHIYSIHRKMTRKKVPLEKLFDLNAVRVLVHTIEDCYTVLSIIQNQWAMIPEEFDDYIATPKPNGYRSIHTVIIGPKTKNVEIQIRTFEMHTESEHGGAAHWQYKEGAQQKTNYQEKIAWLRQVLAWQKELIKKGEEVDPHQTTFLDDRIYVFTPNNEIIEMPQGATPLDFAYHIHSEVGHRCRGAKVNDHLVPLTYTLQTGEKIEILTTKQPSPSRDWINPHLGYLKTPRAKTKVHQWFKLQDYDKNVQDGENLLLKECHRLGIHYNQWEHIADKIHYKNKKDMFAALGSGDLRIVQIIHVIQAENAQRKKEEAPIQTIAPRASKQATAKGIQIAGVGNLLTYTAKCCKPLPGDAIIGFVTKGKGIALHRQDCVNILSIEESQQPRLMQVEWGAKVSQAYPVDVRIEAYDRPGLLRDVTTLIANEKINLTGLSTSSSQSENMAAIHLTIEIDDLAHLSKILDRLKHISNVVDVRRYKS